MFNPATTYLNKLRTSVDWKLLMFLILFMDVKLAVKVAAIVLMYLFSFDFKFGFRLKNSRLPLFYLIVIGIAIIDLVIYARFMNFKYDVLFISGISFWALCILAIHQIKLAVGKNDIEVLHQTITAFFFINALVSLLTLVSIAWEIKEFNPYLYRGMYHKYFIGTGDYVKGITFDVSLTNSVISALGVVYFLFRKNLGMLLLSMMILLFTGSNTINALTIGVLVLVFILRSTRDQKSLITACIMLQLLFMFKISPENSNYTVNTVETVFHRERHPIVATVTESLIPDAQLNPDQRKARLAQHYLNLIYKKLAETNTLKKMVPVRQAKIDIPKPNIHTKPYWESKDTTAMQFTLLNFIHQNNTELPISGGHTSISTWPGKIVAMVQTLKFLYQHPQKALTGDGLGNFSSKIAFKATNLGFTGTYPAKYVYIAPDFLANHLDVYLNFFSKKAGLHSVINNPNSVYFQLLGEYGLIGIVAFVIFYLGYFLKHYKALTYGIPLLVFLLGALMLEYWFEQLSVMILAELMLLVNIKEGKKALSHD